MRKLQQEEQGLRAPGGGYCGDKGPEAGESLTWWREGGEEGGSRA